jgi:MFS family permease
VFETGADGFGLGSTMLAVGAVSGALLAARRRRPSRRLVLGAALTFGVLEFVTGLMPTYVSFLVLLVPTGMALLTFTTASNALLQLRVAQEMRGRVMGLYMLVFLGSAPFGSPVIGWLADALGARASLLAGGVVSVAAALVCTAVSARTPVATSGPASTPDTAQASTPDTTPGHADGTAAAGPAAGGAARRPGGAATVSTRP